MRDRALGTTERVSVAHDGASANLGSYHSAISADGATVVFQSSATNLVEDDTNGADDLFARLRATGVTIRASVGTDGQQGEGPSHSSVHSVSGDGRYVLFSSNASNLIPDDRNSMPDLFVKDVETGAVERVNVSSGAQETRDLEARNDFRTAFATTTATITADGRFVLFSTRARDLVPVSGSVWPRVMLRDRQLGTTELIGPNFGSVRTYGADPAAPPAITPEGRYLAFAGNWGSGGRWMSELYVLDRSTGSVDALGLGIDGERPNAMILGRLAISSDGRYVAFPSQASNLVPNDTNGRQDIFVWDRLRRVTERVSVSGAGVQAEGISSDPSMSWDGRYVLYNSSAPNLVAGDGNTYMDVFVHDRVQRTTRLVSVGLGGTAAAYGGSYGSISGNGKAAAFWSYSADLTAGDANGKFDIFVRDLKANRTRRASVSKSGSDLDGLVGGWPQLSGDAGFVAFSTDASNIAGAPADGSVRTYLCDLSVSFSPPPSPAQLGVTPLADRLRLTWTDRSPKECGFRIERKIGAKAFAEVAQVPENTTSWEDTTAKPDTLYTYRVRTLGVGAPSAYSNQATGSYGAPAAPSDLLPVVETPTQIRLTWKDNSGAEALFRIDRRILSGTFEEVGSSGANRPVFVDSTASPETEYYYRVRAVGRTGEESASRPALVSTKTPETPLYLRATVLTGTTAELTWRDMSAGESSFWVERRIGTRAYQLVARTGPEARSWKATGLTPGTVYTYRVKAVSGAGHSAWSNEAVAKLGGW